MLMLYSVRRHSTLISQSASTRKLSKSPLISSQNTHIECVVTNTPPQWPYSDVAIRVIKLLSACFSDMEIVLNAECLYST